MKEDSRTELVQFRTTKKEKAARQKAADSAGMTLSDWCRKCTEVPTDGEDAR